jgi:hypothetical protein
MTLGSVALVVGGLAWFTQGRVGTQSSRHLRTGRRLSNDRLGVVSHQLVAE